MQAVLAAISSRDKTIGPNSVIPGALTLLSTFNCISVRAKYTNDTNNNATASIRFRTTAGPGAWNNAYTPIVDRRAIVATAIGDFDNTPFQFEARGSIVGLTQNTSYDVEVTWADADGVDGTNPVTGTVSTLNRTPPTGGSTFYVDGDAAGEGVGSSADPFKTLTNAITNTVAGDTILVRDSAAAYAALTISVSGTASAFRVLQNDVGHTPHIATGAADCVIVNGNYWKIAGFIFDPSVESSVHIGTDQHHIFIQSCTTNDIGTGVPTAFNAAW